MKRTGKNPPLGKSKLSAWVLALAVVSCQDMNAQTRPSPPAEPLPLGAREAIFAGGCFWCMEPPFDKTKGVLRTISGYTGGPEKNPSYKEVASGRTGHVEAVKVIYSPREVSYQALLEVFWRNIDPTDDGGQFVDRGSQYRSAIFFRHEAEQEAALRSKKALEGSGRFEKKIVTTIRPASDFWPAEAYHQDFYLKDPSHYRRYRSGSGRDEFLKKIWKIKRPTP